MSEREKDRKRWHQRKAAGSVKLVGELSECDVIIGLRYWPSNVRVESMSASESTCVDETLSQYYRGVLQKLHQCSTFEDLVATSKRLECSLCYTLGIPTSPLHVDVDQQAIKGLGKAKCPKKLAQKRVVLSLTILLHRLKTMNNNLCPLMIVLI